jgi:DNA modification methylase
MLDTVLHGDALALLKTLPDNSVDSIVTDPPAGISFMGKEWDNPDTFPFRDRTAEAKKSGREDKVAHYGLGYQRGNRVDNLNYSKKGRDAFIAFLREVMTEALRVLKPGGHALVWALPRTSHWTATALEDAGFEVRDKLYHVFGSGFPKSLDVSKAIDKQAGKEREVIGQKIRLGDKKPYPYTYNGMHEGYHRPWMDDSEHVEKINSITTPATPEAQQWQGWGSATKPAVEEWVLCRKPLSESSIAKNVLKWGTGAINVDATRISHNEPIKTTERTAPRYSGNTMNNGVRGGIQSTIASANPQGRFPSHLLLSHSLFCVPASCEPDCPIAELDRQSGVRKSGARVHPQGENDLGTWRAMEGMPNTSRRTKASQYEASTGGASRYFQNFPPSDFAPFHYVSKASRSERNRGCEALPSTQGFDKNTSKQIAHINHATGETTYNEYKPSSNGNGHPTVKPLALMRWLIRLITPPGGVVLDPFGGSGSTAVAAIQEGMHFILIEQSEEYVAICNARIAYAMTHEPEVVQVATKKIQGNRWGKGNGRHNIKSIFNQANECVTTGHADADGMETVEDWDCAPDCPIRILGEQSGVSVSKRSSGRNGRDDNQVYSKISRKLDLARGHNDTGTAARYFQQFPPDSLFAECDVEVAI